MSEVASEFDPHTQWVRERVYAFIRAREFAGLDIEDLQLHVHPTHPLAVVEGMRVLGVPVIVSRVVPPSEALIFSSGGRIAEAVRSIVDQHLPRQRREPRASDGVA